MRGRMHRATDFAVMAKFRVARLSIAFTTQARSCTEISPACNRPRGRFLAVRGLWLSQSLAWQTSKTLWPSSASEVQVKRQCVGQLLCCKQCATVVKPAGLSLQVLKSPICFGFGWPSHAQPTSKRQLEKSHGAASQAHT